MSVGRCVPRFPRGPGFSGSEECDALSLKSLTLLTSDVLSLSLVPALVFLFRFP